MRLNVPLAMRPETVKTVMPATPTPPATNPTVRMGKGFDELASALAAAGSGAGAGAGVVSSFLKVRMVVFDSPASTLMSRLTGAISGAVPSTLWVPGSTTIGRSEVFFFERRAVEPHCKTGRHVGERDDDLGDARLEEAELGERSFARGLVFGIAALRRLLDDRREGPVCLHVFAELLQAMADVKPRIGAAVAVGDFAEEREARRPFCRP